MLGPDQMHAWLRRAAPGESVVYSAGDRPGREIAGVARALHEAGLVSLTSKRSAEGFRFIAERRATPIGAPATGRSNRGRFRIKPPVRRSAETTILRVLRMAADRGQPCPTNAELAAIAGLSGAVAASYRMRRLVAAGKIAIAEPGPLERRVVTILAAGAAVGKSTTRAPL